MRLTTFASGSGGNCALLSMDGVHILLDAGISFRRIKENLALSGLKLEALSAVLITHEHSDHVGGLATMMKNCSVPVCAPRIVANRLRCSIAGANHFLREIPLQQDFSLGALTVRAFPTPHDTEQSVGWRVSGSGIFALATDMGCVTEAVRGGLLGADAVLIEANHDEDMLCAGRYPAMLKRRILSDRGHLSNARCGELAAYLADHGTQQIVLGHLSGDNNTPAMAFRTVSAALEGKSTALYVAPASERFTLEVQKEKACSV